MLVYASKLQIISGDAKELEIRNLNYPARWLWWEFYEKSLNRVFYDASYINDSEVPNKEFKKYMKRPLFQRLDYEFFFNEVGTRCFNGEFSTNYVDKFVLAEKIR